LMKVFADLNGAVSISCDVIRYWRRRMPNRA
jgi:hypothetical protein